MSLFLAKKQEDYNQKKVRDLLRLKENKKCFDCPTKSPSFVNTTIQTFVCARCSGLVREVGHRVKAVSASKFSGAELLALKQGGNGVALKIWLSNYSTHDSPEPESDADVRAFMKQKYYENKWLDRALLQSHKEAFRTLLAKSFTEDGLPIVTKSKSKILSGFSRIPLIADSEMNIMNDDEEEESDVQLKQQQDFTIVSPPVYNPPVYNPPVYSPPVYSPPTYSPSTYSQPISYSIPAPTSPITPVGRESMESTYSSSSQGEPQEDYVSSSRRRVKGSQRSVTSSGRDSMDSTASSTNTPATSCAASVLTAEEIAERCRVSIDSNSVQPSKVIEEEQVVVAPETIIEQKTTPPALQINVAEANKNFNQYQQQQQDQYGHQQQNQYQQKQDQYQYQEQQRQQQEQYEQQQRQLQQQYEQYQRHQEQYKHQQQQRQQLKTPTLVNFGNSIQSPSSSVNGNVSASASPVVTPSTSKTLNPSNTFDSIIMELSGLKLEKTARRATYNGGILSPASIQSPPTPSTSTDGLKSADDSKSRPASLFDPSVFSKQVAPQQQTLPENDLYAALRGIPSPVVHVPKEEPKEEVKEFAFSEDDEDEDDPWQEFCSSSSVDENEDITATPPAQVIQPMMENNVKPMIAMDIFGDLDPRAMFKRF